MKTFQTLALVAVILAAFPFPGHSPAADAPVATTYEYATIRWAGRDNTHLIRPDGTTEILGSQLKALRKPDRVDERSFYMNVAMNALAREGYELVAMTPDDYVMRRRASK